MAEKPFNEMTKEELVAQREHLKNELVECQHTLDDLQTKSDEEYKVMSNHRKALRNIAEELKSREAIPHQTQLFTKYGEGLTDAQLHKAWELARTFARTDSFNELDFCFKEITDAYRV